MGAQLGLKRGDVVALASVVAGSHVTQIANRTVGVHAVVPHGALRRLPLAPKGRDAGL
jgi:acetamidase/formamidase